MARRRGRQKEQAEASRRFGINALTWGTAATVVVVTLVAFWPALSAKFLDFDDQDVLVQNPDFVHPELSDMSRYWREPYLELYTPLSYTLLGVTAALTRSVDSPGTVGPLNPKVFHFQQLLIHLIAALWVYSILLTLLDSPGGTRGIRFLSAGAGALLFAIHPLQTEAVAWVSSTNTMLSGMLSLWSIWHYLCYAALRDTAGIASSSASWRRVHWCAGLMVFILAMLAKPSAIVAPALAAVLAVGVLRVNLRVAVVTLLPWVVAAAPFIIVARLSQGASDVPPVAWYLRPLVATDAFAFYLAKLIVPWGLRPDYGRTPAAVIAQGWVFWTWLLPAGLLLLGWLLRRRWPALLAGLVVFMIAVLPVSGLTPFELQIISTVADRYTYLSMLGASVVLATGVTVVSARFPVAKLLVAGVSCAILLVLGVLTFLQSTYWKDDDTLFDRTLALDPGSLVAHRVLGHRAAVGGDNDLAVRHYGLAVITHPGDREVEYNWGNLLLKHNQPREAASHYRRALLSGANDADLHFNLGVALSQSGVLLEALDQFQEALRIRPAWPDAEAYLGQIYEANGNELDALSHYHTALELDHESTAAAAGMERIQKRHSSNPPG